MKVVVNKCFGGFSISKEAAEHMAANGSEQAKAELADTGRFHGYGYSEGFDKYNRADPLLVAAVEALGEKANGKCARLCVTEIPDSIDWEIDDYDGMERIAEKHRTW